MTLNVKSNNLHLVLFFPPGLERGQFYVTTDLLGKIFCATAKGASPSSHKILDHVYRLIGLVSHCYSSCTAFPDIFRKNRSACLFGAGMSIDKSTIRLRQFNTALRYDSEGGRKVYNGRKCSYVADGLRAGSTGSTVVLYYRKAVSKYLVVHANCDEIRNIGPIPRASLHAWSTVRQEVEWSITGLFPSRIP
jgi:hypothetical protein